MSAGPRRGLAIVAGAVALALVAVVSDTEPAAAHGVGGIQPTNYQTVITGMRPAVPGIAVRVVDLGSQLEITNHTGRDVVVLGYDGEPYLRVGPKGTFENRRSPATYVNRTTRGTTSIPKSADSSAPPEWRKVGDAPVARWHDHRAHWMGADDPPSVQADRSQPHLVQRFTVALERAGTRIRVRGIVEWIPPQSAWLWLAFAFVLAASVVALSRTRWARAAIGTALVVVAIGETLHIVGAWGATTLGVGTRLGASVYEAGGIAVALVALGWLWRRGVHGAAPLVLVAGLFVAIAGGLGDVTTLSRSQLPTTLTYDLARAIVATAIGLGVGLAVAGALRLRPEPRSRQGASPASWPATQS
jgi:hypothetical protein